MRDSAATKNLIERTALKLFSEKGIRETTIRDIAETAGIAEGTLYRHYAGKDELSNRLFVNNYIALGAELQRIEQQEQTTKDKIEAMIRYFCVVYEKDKDVFNYLFLTRHNHIQKLTPRLPNPYLVFRRVIRLGMNKGEIPKQDADVAASMVLGVVLQVIDSRLLSGRIQRSISGLADQIAQGAWKVLQ